MSSKPQRRPPAKAHEASVPYASYAQLIRMLLPLTGRVSFYDEQGEALWISDGLEEPELRTHIEILLSRCANEDPGETPVDCSAGEHGQPTYVFPIRTPSGVLVGAMAVVFRDVAAGGAIHRRVETVERLLAPLLEILSCSWRTRTKAEVPILQPLTDRSHAALAAESQDGSTALPALRRTLALATHRLQCAFGAFVVTEQSFTLTHRASPDESDVTLNAAIDAVRGPMLKLMQVRHDALIINRASGRDQAAPYKVLALPLRASASRLAGIVLLFRHERDRDFTSVDLNQLLEIVARLSPPVLAELAAETIEAPSLAPISNISIPTAARAPHSAEKAAPIVVPPVRPRAPPVASVPLVVTPDATPAMDERIRIALRDGRFDLFAQRISPLRDTRRPARFEVLVRMQEGDRLRAPASFFEAAEASALLPELDRWVIRRLLGTLRNHAALVRSGGWEFCINIAAQSLLADRFGEFIVAEVCKSSIPAGLLVFEVSECDALEHQYALEFLGARLRDVGCRIALDNCRAGLATFGPLHRWPISCVKIDGSLIGKLGKLGSHTRSESIVRAVTQLAASMGIETVAERVQSADVCDKLLDIGIDYAQGFHFGPPQPLATVFQA